MASGNGRPIGGRVLNRRWGRGALLAGVGGAGVALIAAGPGTGAFAVAGRMLGTPAAVRIPANQPAAAVKATKPPVPDPPWASQLPPNVVYPIWTDTTKCYYEGQKIDCKDPNGAGYLNPLDNCYWAA